MTNKIANAKHINLEYPAFVQVKVASADENNYF